MRGLGSSQRRQKLLTNSFDILHHFVIPKPDNKKAVRFQETIPLFVVFAFTMLSAVDLDDNVRVDTRKIDNIFSNWKLPPEFKPAKTTVAQAQPQFSFSIGLIAPKLARDLTGSAHSPSP